MKIQEFITRYRYQMGNFLIVNNSADRIRRLLAEPSNQRWIMENLSAGSALLSQRLHRQSRKGSLHSRGRNRHRCCASSGRAHRMLAEQPVRNFLCGQTCSESGRACPRPLTGRFFVKPLGKVFSWVEAGDVCLLSRERKRARRATIKALPAALHRPRPYVLASTFPTNLPV